MLLAAKILAALNQILAAGIVITAFALLLYALTFNLRERVARAFAALLAFVTVIYFCDVVVSTLADIGRAAVWLRLQWMGIAFIPVAYLHFSDALLATTGLPSRGRRRRSIRIVYLIAVAFVAAAVHPDIHILVTEPTIEGGAAHLRAGWFFTVFLAYVVGCLIWVAWNFARAYRRCQTTTTRRRMIYLMAAAGAPLLGSFPFLLVVGHTAALHPLTFWSMVFATNAMVAVLLVVMTYAVAFFGVTQPDRVVRARLFRWIVHGPLVASVVLSVYVVVNRLGPSLPVYDPRALPFLLVGTLLLLQFLLTLVRPPVERLLFCEADRADLRRLQVLEERLLTSGDLHQFLEMVLAAVCDALRTPAAFIAALGDDGRCEYIVGVGAGMPLSVGSDFPPLDGLQMVTLPPPAVDVDGAFAQNGAGGGPSGLLSIGVFAWGDYWLVPLHSQSSGEPLGLLGLCGRSMADWTADETATLQVLAGRAAAALEDRRLQQVVFGALDRLLPQIEAIQRLRASAHYSGARVLTVADRVIQDPDLAQMVKDALSHYWGGPKLTASPLMHLRVVERALREHDGNPANALRSVLQQALERLRPAGQRKFTADWLLYNILDMRFIQHRRGREIAMRLAVSEADLYRKQRVALEEVARAIVAMEREAAERATDYDVAG